MKNLSEILSHWTEPPQHIVELLRITNEDDYFEYWKANSQHFQCLRMPPHLRENNSNDNLLYKVFSFLNNLADERFKRQFPNLSLKLSVTVDPLQERKISEVQLPFTAEEWVDLLNPNGVFLPYCCSEVSYLRDLLVDSLRNGQWIKMNDLHNFVQVYEGHHHSSGDILNRVINIWHQIKSHIDLSSFLNIKTFRPQDNLVRHLASLNDSSANLFWEDCKKNPDNSVKLLNMAKIYPLIRQIFDILSKQKDFFGFVILDQEKNPIYFRSSGIALFDKKQKALNSAENLRDIYKATFFVANVVIQKDGKIKIYQSTLQALNFS